MSIPYTLALLINKKVHLVKVAQVRADCVSVFIHAAKGS